MTKQKLNCEDGFTLIETLIALIILAVSAGLMLQSISTATSKLQKADRLQNAKQLAISVLAERHALINSATEAQGKDEQSGLYWYFNSEIKNRKSIDKNYLSVYIDTVYIRLLNDKTPIYILKNISLKEFNK